MQELYVIVRSDPGHPTTETSIEGYTDQAVAAERVDSLRGQYGNKYLWSYKLIPVDQHMPTAYQVTFSPISHHWETNTVPLSKPPARESGTRPEVVHKSIGSSVTFLWQWDCVYAFSRAEAIQKCKAYAAALFKEGA